MFYSNQIKKYGLLKASSTFKNSYLRKFNFLEHFEMEKVLIIIADTQKNA